jgi:hypothetical protein
MQDAARHPLKTYTIEGHATANRVHYLTARSDLKKLVDLGYLKEERAGKGKRFAPSERLARLVKSGRAD